MHKHKIAVEKINRKELLKERDKTTLKKKKFPLVFTYNRSLPNIGKVSVNIETF